MTNSYAICELKDDSRIQIYECPSYALHVDDKVMVESNAGKREAKVVAVLDYVTDEMYTFIKVLTQNDYMNKVQSIVREQELTYSED